jgi:tRNA A37 threonylcarbamoyltransferase TsaD
MLKDKSNHSKAEEIPDDFFSPLVNMENMTPMQLFSLLAKYGDPMEYTLPVGFSQDNSGDMSFTGISTNLINKVG